MHKLFSVLFVFIVFKTSAQVLQYTTSNAHAHNDYENVIPFELAYSKGFGSIEADIFLQNDSLFIGHDLQEIKSKRTLEAWYLKPLLSHVQQNKGSAYKDSTKELQLMIDIKTGAAATLNKLVEVLKKYPALINCHSVKFVISGNRPDESLFKTYPSFIWFDGELSKTYSADALNKIVMLSDDLQQYTLWNGKGGIPVRDQAKLDSAVQKAHALHKKVRFWNAPDFINAWYVLMHLGADYINTDHIEFLASFLNQLSKTAFTATEKYTTYQPTYKTDGIDKPVKNVILLIGDGTGLAQLYAGYTANKGDLNIFKMLNIGLSKTSSYDNYVTDSAPGSTSISSGVKTNNRFIGVDHTGAVLPLLPVFLEKKNIKTGLVTCGDITDATPADFYAHQSERDDAIKILQDLKTAPIDILIGSGNESLDNVDLLNEPGKEHINEAVINQLQSKYTVVTSVDSVKENENKKWVVIEKKAGLSMLKGRGDWLQNAFSKTVDILSKNKEGFFLMTEGAQVDYGGHANSLPYVATEVIDFDKVVGKALQFADEDGETLVIVTADHETGGLTLLGGDYAKGFVFGQFATNDHTAIPVPVFAYGPQSQMFRGMYENTALFSKILKVFGIAQYEQ
jgi:alkaline phosphatase